MNLSKALPGTIAHCTRATCKSKQPVIMEASKDMAWSLMNTSSHDHEDFLQKRKIDTRASPLSDLVAALLFEGFEALTHLTKGSRHTGSQQ